MKHILATVTGPSAAGKSHLVDDMLNRGLINKIISHTTRQSRPNEKEGIDYYFTDEKSFKWMSDRGSFIEEVEFNGTLYGTTQHEIESKVDGKKPAVIIVEPKGVTMYAKICKNNDIEHVKIFVNTSEELRLSRLEKRFCDEYNIAKTDDSKLNALKNFSKRFKSMLLEEKSWIIQHEYDIFVPGNDLDLAVEIIQEFCARR